MDYHEVCYDCSNDGDCSLQDEDVVESCADYQFEDDEEEYY